MFRASHIGRGIVATFFVAACRLWADDLTAVLQASDGISYPVAPTVSNPVVQIETFAPAPSAPVTFAISATAALPMAYTVEALVGHSATLQSLGPAMVEISNNAGGISGTSSGYLSFQVAPGAWPDQISNGALRIIGAPGYYAVSGSLPLAQYIGGDISWTHTGTIGVSGDGVYVSSGSLRAETGWIASGSLNPAGFRTAELSGLVAVSYGDQAASHSHTWPGGNVSVTSSGVISMANDSSTQITAGISAATTTGPGTDYPDPATPPPAVTVTLDNGQIENSADAGIGVMATAAGAQFVNGHNGEGDTAFGGAVTVNLLGDQGSSITLSGSTGVGVFAVSEVYSVSDTPKNSKVQAGVVTVNNGTVGATGSSIEVGNADSLFSMGILAVSAGQDLFISPYSAQRVNGHGIGNAGEVMVNNFGSVSAAGKFSAGIVGLSIGGPGIVTTNSGTVANSALGSSSGAETNGQGDAVTITNAGAVTTVGANAYGVVALSSGGGGVINNDIEIIADANGVATNGLIVGNDSSSSSGSASPGGTILVTNSGTISTGDGTGAGVASMGVVAQSIGGAGGNAGGDHAAWFVGDKGGQGGNGGATTVTLDAGSLLTTQDENSIGVLAQSIGGGGGNGANAKGLFVAVGGNGGVGGDGGTVTITVNGALNTQDDYSAGVIAQSIGGGGGHGGTATAVGIGAAFGLGGHGGSGGEGGEVDGSVGAGGVISTVGNNSTAFHLQSVGGGGGTGGAAIAKSIAAGTGEDVTLDFNMAVGGSGGSGGEGGTVFGTNAGMITTGVAPSGSTNGAPNMDGGDSYGMMAQSIGGGGGQGGLATAKSLALNLSGTEGGTINPDDAEVDPGPVATTSNLTISIGANISDSGSGGKGNDGGSASLTNFGGVTTYGDGSIAMIAQSIGGGGGSGGDSTAAAALSAATGQAFAANLNLGGGGGNGGSGGSVTMSNSGAGATIQTYGQNANGMVGQSIGGGGGNAAIGNSGTSNLHTPVTGSNAASTVAISFALGGSGGKGGHAGYAELENFGLLSTAGSGANGILAQAIGGGGGNASGGVADGSNNSYTLDLAIGGKGGDGGSASGTNTFGQSVTVLNSGTILTVGGDASGIVAQSIGGGGGNGGSADAQASIGAVGTITNTLFSGTKYQSNITIGAAIGGSGGGGGAGGNVTVDQDGLLSTSGFQSFGILAQSISGGGGKGGSATAQANPGLFDVFNQTLQFGAVVAVGGKGGDSHNGGVVTVNAAGLTSTGGYGAHAVVAQSVAGGGGVGADGTADVTSSLGLGATVGNVSGTMGQGGTVTVNQTANIATAGADAAGIVAQSISAGGGLASTGQDRKLLTLTPGIGILPVHLDFTLGVNLHGSDQANGGAVMINSGTFPQSSAPAIETAGDLSHGMVAQSIGAGGGKASSIFGTDSPAYADFSGTITREVSGTIVTSARGITLGAVNGHGSGGTVNINLVNTAISTGVSGSTGYGAYGVLAQSLGGGGGLASVDTAAANGVVWLGGTSSAQGVGGHGGAVDFTGGGFVTTHGDAAHGVVLQSIGGGGGVAIVGSSRDFTGTAAPTGLAVDVTLGSHNSYGLGGAVTSSAAMDIQTSGANAFGLVAQSIGGGGGIAASQQGGTASLGMQASGTESYNGGSVSVFTSYSNIATSGDGSHGVVAQSIGGGGGITNPSSAGGLTTSPAVINSGTAKGYGGAVNVNVTGTIQTTGDGAFGVVAQTISGGGGLSGSFAGSTGGAHSTGNVGSGTAGNVTVTSEGGSTISAAGAGSTAIFAQNDSAGSLGKGNVTVNVAGSVVGGSGTNGYGIWVDGGTSGNSIIVEQGGKVSAASGNAINYTGSVAVNVQNSGMVKGAVSLSGDGSFVGIFNNTSDGSFYAEGDIRGNVNNNGSFIVGIDGNEAATAVLHDHYGSSISSEANLDFDAFSTSEYDRIVFSDDGAGSFAGNVQVDLSDSYQAREGDTFYLINPGSNLTNLYEFDSYQITYQGQSVLSYDGTPMEIAGIRFSFLVIEPFQPDANSFILTVTSIPEPAVALLVLFGVGGLLVRRTRMIRME